MKLRKLKTVNLRIRGRLRVILGLALTLLFLWLATRGVDPSGVVAAVKGASFPLMGFAVAIGVVGFLLRSVRYAILVCPGQPLPIRQVFPACMIGFASNNLLPGRLGDFFRAYSVGEKNSLSKGTTLAALGVERVLDVVTLVAFMAVSIRSFQVPELIVQSSMGTGLLALVILLALGGAARYGSLTMSAIRRVSALLPQRFGGLLTTQGENLLLGLDSLRSAHALLKVVSLSLATWAIEATSLYVFLLAFNQVMPPEIALLIIGFSGMLNVVPTGPGNFGTTYLAFVISLGLLGVSQDTALAIGIAFHGVHYAWVTAVGLFFAWRGGLTLTPARRDLAPALIDGRVHRPAQQPASAKGKLGT